MVTRVYTIPLRRKAERVSRWRRTERAVSEVRLFLQKHMKSQDVRISPEVNEFIWVRGIKHPPARVKVEVTKDEKGVVLVRLFGVVPQEKPKEGLEATLQQTSSNEPAATTQ